MYLTKTWKNAVQEGTPEKHENYIKNQSKKPCFLMAPNHVWRYTLRLFHTFGLFEKNRKIDAKREPKSCGFWFKMRPWAPKGRLILPFWLIFEKSKNQWFFDVALGLKKSIKNRALGVQGFPEERQVATGWRPGEAFQCTASQAAPFIKEASKRNRY